MAHRRRSGVKKPGKGINGKQCHPGGGFLDQITTVLSPLLVHVQVGVLVFDFKVIMRASRVRSKLTESPCKRSWGAIRRNSMPNMCSDLGQRVPAVISLPASSVIV